MRAKWLIEDSDLERDNWNKIAAYLEKTNREYTRTKYVPFTSLCPETLYDKHDCVIAFGCLGLVRSVINKSAWLPGAWCDFEALKCSNYLSHWGRYSIHHRYCFLPWLEVVRNRESLFPMYSANGQLFIRPDDNFKTFNGELVALEHWDAFVRNVECYDPSGSTLCMISTPSIIEAEWRFVIADRKVLTGSQYRLKGSAEIDKTTEKGAVDFAEEVANSRYNPHSIYCMDICRTEDKYRLMEIGCVNGAGLYDMDIELIVDKANEIAEREWSDVHST